jgi:hypothetical protein
MLILLKINLGGAAMDEKKSITNEFMRYVTTTFTYTVLSVSMLGFFIGDTLQENTIMSAFGYEGLSHRTIFQLILLSVINSGLSLIIDRIFKKQMLLWRIIITMPICLVATGIMIAGFRWLPLDSWTPWIVLAAVFTGIYVLTSSILIIKTKLADKKYEKLLSDYKIKQKKGE